jgi:hypothetical protein
MRANPHRFRLRALDRCAALIQSNVEGALTLRCWEKPDGFVKQIVGPNLALT